MTFSEFSLHARLQRAITEAGYEEPTPIQAAAIPIVLDGKDLVGTAQTGTGKTAAFVLPILHRLLSNQTKTRAMRALILTPTRELAEQIHATIRQLGMHTNIRSATVYGGVGMAPQERALKNGTEIIVACPGRLLDHIARGNVNLDHVECVVLDEADRMLDMGFLPPITRIMGLLPAERQTLLFSATFAPELNKFVKKTLRDPERLEMDIVAPATTVAHCLYPVHQLLKTRLLTTLLRDLKTDSVLVFTRTKHRADHVAEHLNRAGINAGVLHSNKSQRQRQDVLDGFRQGKYPCLVATDIAARGIDVASISHVINFDIPGTADDYIHRIGRTGRAARSGQAFTFVTNEDKKAIRDIERVLGEPLESQFHQGFDYQQVPSTAKASGNAPSTRKAPAPKGSVKSSGMAPKGAVKPAGMTPKGAGPRPVATRSGARPGPKGAPSSPFRGGSKSRPGGRGRSTAAARMR